jgi:hypothetical protein
MAKMKLIHPLSLLLFLWGMAGVGVCQNTINNGVAAVVNSEAITFREVLAQTQMEEDDLRAQQQAGKITDDERKQRIKSRRKTVLDSLIETRLIIQDYKKKGYNGYGISLAEIDKRW